MAQGGGSTAPGERRQREVYFAGLLGRRPAVPVDARRLERRARRAMSTEGYEYIAGGAGLETTWRARS